jgi:hypothetical protein
MCRRAATVLIAVPAAILTATTDAQEFGESEIPANAAAAPSKAPAAPKLPEPKGAKRLSREYDVWVDPRQKAVLVDGQISLREGMLEMFACTRNTKEHESIVSANTKAFLVHAALLTVGAEPGSPVRFMPQYVPPSGNWLFDLPMVDFSELLPPIYVPPSGTEIEVQVHWTDPNGRQLIARAQDWIKDIQTGKPMTHPFVFAGSSFWTDEETGKKYYQAEQGDFICVSNFSTAMLDIPVESSQTNTELAFEAFTERIPPLGAPVRLVLKPKLSQQGATQRVPGREQGGSKTRAAKAEGNVLP